MGDPVHPFSWADSYDVFMFDFDGLLVDTDDLLYKCLCMAVSEVTAGTRSLGLTFDQYQKMRYGTETNHGAGSKRVQEYLSGIIQPEMVAYVWALKGELYRMALINDEVNLKPGVESLLRELVKRGKKLGVVTLSPGPEVDEIRARIPVLAECIPTEWWMVRGSYPHKNKKYGYRNMIQDMIDSFFSDGLKHQHGDDLSDTVRVIGFEDTPSSYYAMVQAMDDKVHEPELAVHAEATPVLLSTVPYTWSQWQGKGFRAPPFVFRSFVDIPEEF